MFSSCLWLENDFYIGKAIKLDKVRLIKVLEYVPITTSYIR